MAACPCEPLALRPPIRALKTCDELRDGNITILTLDSEESRVSFCSRKPQLLAGVLKRLYLYTKETLHDRILPVCQPK